MGALKSSVKRHPSSEGRVTATNLGDNYNGNINLDWFSFLGLLIGSLIRALPVMLLWNSVVPSIFGMKVISFTEALMLSLLSSCLFKSTPSLSSSK